MVLLLLNFGLAALSERGVKTAFLIYIRHLADKKADVESGIYRCVLARIPNLHQPAPSSNSIQNCQDINRAEWTAEPLLGTSF